MVHMVNREHERRLLHDRLDDAIHHPRHLALVEVTGDGGMGKTCLMRYAYQEAQKAQLHTAIVEVGSDPLEVDVRPLDSIHAQLGLSCPVYRYARTLLSSSLGQNVYLPSGHAAEQTMTEAVAELAQDAFNSYRDTSIPASLLSHALEKTTSFLALRRAEPELLAEAQQARTDPVALRMLLPRCLARDLRQACTKASDPDGPGLTILYDDYRGIRGATAEAELPWIGQFIAELGEGLHILSGRISLDQELARWKRLTTRFDAVNLQSVTLAPLSDDDIQTMIHDYQPDLASHDCRRIVEASIGSPFMANAALSPLTRGLDLKNWRRIVDQRDGLLAMMIRHLDDDTQTMAIALATLGIYDEGLFDQLRKELGLRIAIPSEQSTLVASSFCEKHHFVERVPGTELSDTPTLYRVHDLLAQQTDLEEASQAIRLAALEISTRYLKGRLIDTQADRATMLYLIEALFAGWSEQPTMATPMVELMVDICYDFHDSGYWQELGAIRVNAPKGHPITVIERFFEALRVRRTLGPVPALEILERQQVDIDCLGYHQRSYDLELAYFAELAGDYAQARSTFKALDDSVRVFDPSRRDHVRGRQNHADVLFMDGRFEEANRRLSEAQHAPGFDNNLLRSEIVRLRGHTYRFSLLHAEALDLYRDARALGGGTPAQDAKLLTNLAEGMAWLDAEAARHYAFKALEANRVVQNLIEQSKANSALGLAACRLGRDQDASSAIAEGMKLAQLAHYPAGTAFALQASIMAAAKRNDTATAASCYEDLLALVTDLGVYQHLLIVPFHYLSDRGIADGRIEPPSCRPQWIDNASLARRLDQLCETF